VTQSDFEIEKGENGIIAEKTSQHSLHKRVAKIELNKEKKKSFLLS